MGSVTIDLSEAEFDDWEVEIVVHTKMGSIAVIAPRGLDVRQVGSSGASTRPLGRFHALSAHVLQPVARPTGTVASRGD
jgi:hypothetical protein